MNKKKCLCLFIQWSNATQFSSKVGFWGTWTCIFSALYAHSALYLQQLFSWASLLHVHLQTSVQEVSERRRQFLRVLQLRRPVGCYEIQRLGNTHEQQVCQHHMRPMYSKYSNTFSWPLSVVELLWCHLVVILRMTLRQPFSVQDDGYLQRNTSIIICTSPKDSQFLLLSVEKYFFKMNTSMRFLALSFVVHCSQKSHKNAALISSL